LAASVGFRVFLPLFALGVAAYTGLWDLNPSWEWIGSLPAVIAFGVATILEIFGYFIPWFDHLLDSLAIPLAILAGTMVMASTVTDMDPLMTWGLAIIAGGGTATAIKGASATGRLASTFSTAGFGNPLVSTIETGMATLVSLVSLLLPMVGVLLVIVILIFIFTIYWRLRPRIKN